MVRFQNFHEMEPGAYGVVRTLVANAGEPNQDQFLPFVLLWMAFNGWLSAVTDRDRDSKMLADIAAHTKVRAKYDQLINDSATFRTGIEDFERLWPIFDTRAARRSIGISQFRQMDRAAVLACLNPRHIYPHGWIKSADTPPSWEHTLYALYRVRCNLFHGQKTPALERDRALALSAGAVLQTLIEDGRILELTD